MDSRHHNRITATATPKTIIWEHKQLVLTFTGNYPDIIAVITKIRPWVTTGELYKRSFITYFIHYEFHFIKASKLWKCHTFSFPLKMLIPWRNKPLTVLEIIFNSKTALLTQNSPGESISVTLVQLEHHKS